MDQIFVHPWVEYYQQMYNINMAEYIPGFKGSNSGKLVGRGGQGMPVGRAFQKTGHGGHVQFEQSTLPNRNKNLKSMDERQTNFANSKNYPPEPKPKKSFIESVADIFGCASKE